MVKFNKTPLEFREMKGNLLDRYNHIENTNIFLKACTDVFKMRAHEMMTFDSLGTNQTQVLLHLNALQRQVKLAEKKGIDNI